MVMSTTAKVSTQALTTREVKNGDTTTVSSYASEKLSDIMKEELSDP